MKEFEAMKAVYCYFFPEVRQIVSAVESLPKDKLFLTQTPVTEAARVLEQLQLSEPLILTATPNGRLDLDMIHEPVIDRVVEAYRDVVPGLAGLRSRYFTSGSSEGIFHKLSEVKSRGVNSIYTLDGEYEGYQEYGRSVGIETIPVEPNSKPKDLKPGIWFISNPSARDGNIIDNEYIQDICEAGNEVVLDLAYVGATKPYVFDVSHPNISTVFLSFSKPYGLFRERVGFTFSRGPVDSLYANKWFKHIGGLLIGLKVAEEIGPKALWPRYNGVQSKIIDSINQDFGLGIKPSDVLLLAHSVKEDLMPEQEALVNQFRRVPGYRFCLTPYFEMELDGKAQK